MKTFNDLEFGPHPHGDGVQAILFFDNEYGVSVIQFSGSYTNDETEWELAVLKGSEDHYVICYSTEITDDVIGHLSEDKVTEIMKKVQSLSKIK